MTSEVIVWGWIVFGINSKHREMKAILINSKERKIELVNHQGGNLEEIYKLIDCTCIAAPVIFDDRDTLYVDDESWLTAPSKDELAGFTMEHWAYAILGNGLIIGADEEGKDVDIVNDDVAYWEKQITWKDNTEMCMQGMAMGMI
jgi:hypothetical protein